MPKQGQAPMKRLRSPSLSIVTLALIAGLVLPAMASDGAFGDPTAPLPERVTAAEEAEVSAEDKA